MHWKEPKNSDKYYWTSHAKTKMRRYGLTAQRVSRVIKSPLRIEEGIAESTVAAVQPQSTRRGENGEKTWSNEIWVMYQIKKRKKQKFEDKSMDDNMKNFLDNLSSNEKQVHIISAWRYPGKTKPGESLPDEILSEIAEVG